MMAAMSGSISRSIVSLLLVLAACGDDEPGTSIEEARAGASGAVVTVEGHVSVPPGAFVSAMGDQGFAIQDDTGGVYVKLEEKQAYGLGERLRVTGTMDEQNQLRILKAVPGDITKLSGTAQVAGYAETPGTWARAR